MKDNTFQCELCKQVFIKGVSDAEAKQSAIDDLGPAIGKAIDENSDDVAFVCGDCYQEYRMSWMLRTLLLD
jgi:hypothetical protein